MQSNSHIIITLSLFQNFGANKLLSNINFVTLADFKLNF